MCIRAQGRAHQSIASVETAAATIVVLSLSPRSTMARLLMKLRLLNKSILALALLLSAATHIFSQQAVPTVPQRQNAEPQNARTPSATPPVNANGSVTAPAYLTPI